MSLHNETRNGYTIDIEYDEYSDSPTEWGNFKIVQFRDRNFTDYADIDDYLTESGKLRPEWRAKLRAGKAFAFSYSRYSNAGNGYYRYPTSDVAWGEDLTSSDLNGLIIFEDDYIKGTSYEDRKQCATGDLETYTQWANGDVYSVYIYEQNINGEDDEMVDGCGGNIGDFDAILADAQATVDALTPPRLSKTAPRAQALHN